MTRPVFKQDVQVYQSGADAKTFTIPFECFGVSISNPTSQWLAIAGDYVAPSSRATFTLTGDNVVPAAWQAPPGVVQPAPSASQQARLVFTDVLLPNASGPLLGTQVPSTLTVEQFTKSSLPAAGTAGRVSLLTDYDRSLWVDDGTRWRSITSREFDVTAFGAVGDGGITDNGPAFNAAINAIKAAGGGILHVPLADNFYGFTTTIVADDANDGLVIMGDMLHSTTLHVELRWLGGAGSGSLLTFNSAHGIKLQGLRFSYTNAAYNGTLVSTIHSASGLDAARWRIEDCEFAGQGGAVSAAVLLGLSQCIIGTVRNCHFINAVVGIFLGPSYVNVCEISGCDFNACSDVPILFQGGQQTIKITSCTFEPRANGTSAAIRQINFGAFIWGLDYTNNWHGDVSANGGSWINDVQPLGCIIHGNYFGSPGGGATDTAIRIRGQGITVIGNRIETARAIEFTALTLAFVAIGNDWSNVTQFFGLANLAIGESLMLANNGAGLGFYPPGMAAGGGANAGPQNNNALWGGSGIPPVGGGNNGDFYFRADGGAGTSIYMKRGGAWVAIL